jgi:hypothetical protein
MGEWVFSYFGFWGWLDSGFGGWGDCMGLSGMWMVERFGGDLVFERK